ncbi:complex proteins associated with Set1p component shg1-domain-containing protein [Scheffersomyces xylosifermentans]|uniref:complex proteins associated with Set1p component shg1-domain-containing protein n=1 Tax=Scheffersomyces xylosifermentans TaxID=1304137 RepID=UPI00315DB588
MTNDEIEPKQLTTIYKKNGSFDKQRRSLLQNFKQSETHANLLLKLRMMIENKIKQDPSILMKNKGKMGALIQGEIINEHLNNGNSSASSTASNSNARNGTGTGLLSIVDKDIQDKIIDSPEFHKLLRDELKDIRRKLQGISDQDYKEQLKKEAEEEAIRQEQKKAEALANGVSIENDYKNNFRVKTLSTTHRIVKPPRFNFSTRSIREQRSDESSSNNVTESSNGSTDNSAKTPKSAFLKY